MSSVNGEHHAAMIVGLVPAAGASRRMGRDKRCLRCGEGTVLEATVGSLVQGGVSRVVVVLEPASPAASLPGLQQAVRVTNPRPELGMLSSIRCGLAAMPPDAAAAAILPGDHPFVPPAAVRALADHFRRVRPRLLVPRYPERRGHPLLLARELFAEAAACDDDVGLRQLVRRRADELVELPLDFAGADADLDTPDDLRRLR